MTVLAKLAGVAVVSLFACAAPAQTAANYPVRPIRIIDQGQEPQATTPAEFGTYVRAESRRWAEVIKRAGLKAER